jgi:hypothetical protein
MIRRLLASTMSGALLAVLCMAPAAHAADPTDVPAPDPTGAQLTLINQKLDIARDWMSVKAGSLSVASFNTLHPQWAGLSLAPAAAGGTGSVTPMATSGALGLSQVTQTTNYRCGSATAYEILKYQRVSTGPGGETLTQPHLGAKCATGYLCTEPLKNTPWYVGPSYPDAFGYPMPSTLNNWTKVPWYLAHKASAATLADYQSSLVYDIDNAFPVAVDIHEISNAGHHLKGHPSWVESKHWVAAYGYNSTGATTLYADSVHGVPTSVISWAASVPDYASYSSSWLFTLMTEFGYVW